MVRYETEFSIAYSIRLERMTCTLMNRVDRISSFLQLVLGAAVFAKTDHEQLIGVVLVVLSMFSFVWQPAAKAAHAQSQKARYESLQAKSSSLSDDDLFSELTAIQADDSGEIGALCHPAHIGVEITQGQVPSISLTLYEKTVAWLAGDLPRRPNQVVE